VAVGAKDGRRPALTPLPELRDAIARFRRLGEATWLSVELDFKLQL
jgi:hypothetical protein